MSFSRSCRGSVGLLQLNSPLADSTEGMEVTGEPPVLFPLLTSLAQNLICPQIACL